jgi:hypothetical protein
MKRKPLSLFRVEVTDTFGGDANYCWARRYHVKARTMRGAVLMAARDSGYSGRIRKTMDCGDMTRHDVRGACVCMLTEWFDADAHADETHISLGGAA